MTSVEIRAAGAADLPVVAALLREAKLPVDGLEEQFGPSYAVAVVDGRIVGVEGIECYGHAGLLRSAVVDPAFRGQGIGEALTEDRLAWAEAAGLAEVWLLTTTAERWFPRFGFQRTDRTLAPPQVQQSREFAESCPASAVGMRRRLGHAPDIDAETLKDILNGDHDR